MTDQKSDSVEAGEAGKAQSGSSTRQDTPSQDNPCDCCADIRAAEAIHGDGPVAATGGVAKAARPYEIALPGGATLRHQARTTGAPGCLLYDLNGKPVCAMRLTDVEIIEATITAAQAAPVCGAQVASADRYTTTAGEAGEYELRRAGKIIGEITLYDEAAKLIAKINGPATGAQAASADYVLVPRKLNDTMRRAAREKIGFTQMYEAAVEVGQVAGPAPGAEVALPGFAQHLACTACGKLVREHNPTDWPACIVKDRAPAAPAEMHHNFTTHRASWRAAIEKAIAGQRDADQRAYWEHELRAYDEAYGSLATHQTGAEPGTAS